MRALIYQKLNFILNIEAGKGDKTKLLASILIFSLLFLIAGESFAYLLGIDISFFLLKESKLYFFYSACIEAPLYETLVYQFLFYKIFNKYFTVGKCWLIISSALFGLAHFYSLNYITMTFFLGILLNLFYIYYMKKYNPKTAYWSVVAIHFLNNLFNSLILFTA